MVFADTLCCHAEDQLHHQVIFTADVQTTGVSLRESLEHGTDTEALKCDLGPDRSL